MDSSPSRHRHPVLLGIVVAFVALAAAVLAAAAWAAFDDGPGRPTPEVELRFTPEDAEPAGPADPLVPADAAGEPLPDVAFTTLGGEPARLSDYRGRPLVLNFFASWCVPCEAEMPAFEEVHGEVGDEVAFLGLALRDSERDARAIVERTGVTYDVGRDPAGHVFAELGGVVMPSTFLVDADGTVRAAEAGELSAAELRALIDEHLLA